MSISVNFNGTTYAVPESGETNWGSQVTTLLTALAQFSATATVQKTTIREVSGATVSVLQSDRSVIVGGTATTAVVANLPVGISGQILCIVDKDGNAKTNAIAITPNGSEKINGVAAAFNLDWNAGAVILQFRATDGWRVIGTAMSRAGKFDSLFISGDLTLTGDIVMSAGKTVDGVDVGSHAHTGGPGDGVLVDHASLANKGSNTHAQIDSHLSASAAHGVSGNVLGTSDAQVVTNKDIDGGTASNTSRITLPKALLSALQALARKEGTLCYATDTKKPYFDNGTALVAVGASTGSGPVEYVSNPSGVEDSTGAVPAGWTGTGTISVTRTLADLPREFTTGVGISVVMTAAQTAVWAFSLDDVDLNSPMELVLDANVKSGTDIVASVKDGGTVLASATLPSGFSSLRFNFASAGNAPLTLVISTATGGTVVFSNAKINKLPATIESRNNIFINGDFRIWQRALSQTSSGLGSDDRWTNGHAAGSTKTHTRENFTVGQTDVPGEPRYFSRTVIATSSGTSTAVIKDQKVEDVRTLAGKFATLVFWAKANASKSMTVEFEQYFGTGGSPSAFVNFGATKLALTTAWKKYVIFVSVPSLSGKTLGTNEDHYFQVSMWLSAGSDFNSRTNSLGVQTGTFDIAKASLCEGICASTADVRPIAQELALCQRFYEKNDSNETGIWWSGNCTIGQTYYSTAQYKVTKRATAPTIVKVGENADQFGAITISNATINGFRAQAVASSTASAAYFRTGWTAESEL